jgi:hypothetical protein
VSGLGAAARGGTIIMAWVAGVLYIFSVKPKANPFGFLSQNTIFFKTAKNCVHHYNV